MSIRSALRAFGRQVAPAFYERADPIPPTSISVYDWAKAFAPGQVFSFGGQTYQGFQVNQSGGAGVAAYSGNSVVFACEANRLLLFSEARFQWQDLNGGRAGNLFGTQDLQVLEQPWMGATTRDLLSQAELDVLLYGNSYWTRDPQDNTHLLRLDPAKVSILTDAATDPTFGTIVGDRLLAYAYRASRDRVVFYEPNEVAHYKPYPDARQRFIGMSWLNPCLPDVDADAAMTTHKTSQLQSGATLGYVVTMAADPSGRGPSDEQWVDAIRQWRATHEGPENAGKTAFLSPGLDIKTVGQTFEQLSMKATQGAGETRIAACAGVPPVIVGLSEGLSSATYSNYSQARDRLADGTMRPLWGHFASALQSIVPAPYTASRLWYDDRDIPWLRRDVSVQAAILKENATTAQVLINSGFLPDAVIRAIAAGDLVSLVGQHTGLYSVQLQPPGADAAPIRAVLTMPDVARRLDEGYRVLELAEVTD